METHVTRPWPIGLFEMSISATYVSHACTHSAGIAISLVTTASGVATSSTTKTAVASVVVTEGAASVPTTNTPPAALADVDASPTPSAMHRERPIAEAEVG